MSKPETSFLCQIWGEDIDHTLTAIVPDWEGVRRFCIEHYTGSADHTAYDGSNTLATIKENFDEHEADGRGAYTEQWEIGGLSIERICDCSEVESMLVTRITTAYEQGYGHAHRAEISNPYAAGTVEAEAWDQGREIGLSRPAPWNPPPLSTLHDGDVATVVGIKDGVETVLGRMPLPPVSKGKQILRSYGLEDFDDEDSQASYALIAVEDLVRWMRSVGWREPPMQLAEKGAGS